jgi:hypothetical protein
MQKVYNQYIVTSGKSYRIEMNLGRGEGIKCRKNTMVVGRVEGYQSFSTSANT